MDYKAYRAEKNIQSRDMIAAMRDAYPKYGKPTQCMIDNPEKYGVCLTPAAEQLLSARFGQAVKSAPRTRRKPNRAKPNRLFVRLSDELYSEVKRLMGQTNCNSMQDFLETLLLAFVEKSKKHEAQRDNPC